jgi:hypothetical protein
MDLKAMPTPQIGGATVAIVFVCGLSKFCGVVGALSKHKAHLLEAVRAAIALSFTRYGHKVSKVYVDSESALLALAVPLAELGYSLSASPPLQHAQTVERRIRTIGEGRITLLASLTACLPENLTLESYRFVCSMLNLLPCASAPGGASPSSVVVGRHSTIPLDKFLPFGTVVMVQSTATTIARGDAAPKRELGVNLGPDNLASTSLRVVLASGIIVKRDARMCDPVSVKNPFWRPARKTIAPVPRDHFAVSSAPVPALSEVASPSPSLEPPGSMPPAPIDVMAEPSPDHRPPPLAPESQRQ